MNFPRRQLCKLLLLIRELMLSMAEQKDYDALISQYKVSEQCINILLKIIKCRRNAHTQSKLHPSVKWFGSFAFS